MQIEEELSKIKDNLNKSLNDQINLKSILTPEKKTYQKDIKNLKNCNLESIIEESKNNSDISKKKKKIKKKIKNIGKLCRKLSYKVHPIIFRPQLNLKKRDSMYETEGNLLKKTVINFGDNKFVTKKNTTRSNFSDIQNIDLNCEKDKFHQDEIKFFEIDKAEKKNGIHFLNFCDDDNFKGNNEKNDFEEQKKDLENFKFGLNYKKNEFYEKKVNPNIELNNINKKNNITVPTFHSINDYGINCGKKIYNNKKNFGFDNVSISKDILGKEKKNWSKRKNNFISDFDFNFLAKKEEENDKKNNLNIPEEFNFINNKDLNICLFEEKDKKLKNNSENYFFKEENIKTPPRKKKKFFDVENKISPPLKRKCSKKQEIFYTILDKNKMQTPQKKIKSNLSYNYSSIQRNQILNPNIINIKSCSKTPLSNKKKIKFPSSFCSSFSNLQKNKKKKSQFEKNFELIKIIGKGQFGEVYKCQNKYDKLFYAVKIIKKMKNSAINEAQALASLNVMYGSNYIVRYFSSWKEKNKVYIVMEYCSDNLKSYIQTNSHISEIEIRKLIKHICKALKKLHADKIVHLDIKPANILLSNLNHYKLSDLGLVKALYDRNDVESLQEGDSRYMASELLKEISFCDVLEGRNNFVDLTKADIFSLGMTVYKCMLGDKVDLPINGPFWKELRENKVPFLDKLEQYSNSLKRLVLNMVHKDPKKRPTAAEIVRDSTQSFKKSKIQELEREIDSLKAKLEIRI